VTAAPGGDWVIERRTETARVLHEPWPGRALLENRVVGLCAVVGSRAIVLGSTQDADRVDAHRVARDGVDVVRRSSGGGAVVVAPAAQVWLEVWLPRPDPLWDDDVIASSWWLGETWARALDGLGVSNLRVHRGRATRTGWSDMVCFAGVGPGEVTAGTAKVVGIAQRRTRRGARFGSLAFVSWDPASVVSLLALDDAAGVTGASSALDDVAVGVRRLLPPPLCDIDDGAVISAVEDALLSALP
jgi:lipoate---protein ligase